jgi:broad specificity phosphatase PhoE
VTETELLLVRHGGSTWNVAGRMQGRTASPALTDRGRRQAAEAGTQGDAAVLNAATPW